MTHISQLKTRLFSRLGIVVSGAVLVLIIIGAALLTTHKPTTSVSHASTAAKVSSKSTDTSPTLGGGTPSSPGASGNTADADKQTSIAAAAQPVTNACKLLTASAAQQLLGSNAAASSPQGTSSLQATGTSLSACAYSSGDSTVQLVIRAPISSLGRSENATVFGSGKPPGAVNVAGYGQAAYWNPAEHTLNILGSNNWYIITHGSGGSQADAEATAALLKSGF